MKKGYYLHFIPSRFRSAPPSKFLHFFLLVLLLAFSCKTAQYHAVPIEESAIEEYEVIMAPYQPAEPRFHDLLHTRLDLSFDWENRWVLGEAQLTFRPYFYPQDILTLDAKGFDVAGCDLIVKGESIPLSYDYDGELLAIDLQEAYDRTDTLEIKIAYTAKPYERKAGAGQSITSDRGIFFIDPLETDTLKPRQIWTQGETQFNSAWFPTIDAPNERFTQEIFLTVDSTLTTLSNGQLQSSSFIGGGLKRDHWKLDKPHAPYLAMIAIGNFVRVEDVAGDIPLGYYVEPEYAPYAADIFGNTPEMLDFFSEVLNYPFPWSKYDQVVVRDFVSGAMENTTASVFMEDLQVNRRELLDDHWDGIIAHELFHQWFGDLVTCESWANLALNEGFANYAEYLWNEHKYGKEEAGYGLWMEKENYFGEASVKLEPIINYFYDNADDLFDSHRYSKAGVVLHMLREYVGDDVFFAALNLYLHQNALNAVELSDLRKAFEETSGEDLQWFFEQWFESRGHPILEISQRHENDTLYVNIEQTQVSDSVNHFVFPLALEYWVGAERTAHEVLVEAPLQQFLFPVAEAPELVQLDPEGNLLAEINHNKSFDELLTQYRRGNSFVMRRDALEAIYMTDDSVAIGEISLLALADSSPRIREMVLDNLSGKGHIQINELQQLVRGLTFDSSALVRAAAYSLYSESGANDTEELLRKALIDSSYSVVGAGLAGLLPDYVQDPPWLSEFLDIRHLNIAAPIAGYFNEHLNETSSATRLLWYHQNLLHFRGMDRWIFLQFYMEYLVLSGLYEQDAPIQVLFYLATSDNQYYNRISAFQALTLLLPETEDNRNKLAELAAGEENDQARELMNSLLVKGDE